MDNTFENWINEKLVNDGFVSTKQVVLKFHCPLDQSTKKLASFYDTCSTKNHFTALYKICATKNDDSSTAYRFDLVREENIQQAKDSCDRILLWEILAMGKSDVDIMKEYFNEKLDENAAKQISFVRYPKKRCAAAVDVPQSSSSTQQDSILSPIKKSTVNKSESFENSKKPVSKKQKQEMTSFFKKSLAKSQTDSSEGVRTSEKAAHSGENSSMTVLKDELKDTKKSSKTLTLDPTLFSADSSPESSPVKKPPSKIEETSDELNVERSKKRKPNTANTRKETKNVESSFKNDKKVEIENKINGDKQSTVEADKIQGPIRRTKMVHNTYLDEDGYLVTMKESRTEIVPNSNTKTENKPKSNSEMKNGSLESTGNGKPSDGLSSKKDEKTVGKAQSTLTSFFKK